MAIEGSSLGAELDDMVPLKLPPASTEDCVAEVIEEAKTIDNGIADPASTDARVEEVTEKAKTIDNGIASMSVTRQRSVPQSRQSLSRAFAFVEKKR